MEHICEKNKCKGMKMNGVFFICAKCQSKSFADCVLGAEEVSNLLISIEMATISNERLVFSDDILPAKQNSNDMNPAYVMHVSKFDIDKKVECIIEHVMQNTSIIEPSDSKVEKLGNEKSDFASFKISTYTSEMYEEIKSVWGPHYYARDFWPKPMTQYVYLPTLQQPMIHPTQPTFFVPTPGQQHIIHPMQQMFHPMQNQHQQLQQQQQPQQAQVL